MRVLPSHHESRTPGKANGVPARKARFRRQLTKSCLRTVSSSQMRKLKSPSGVTLATVDGRETRWGRIVNSAVEYGRFLSPLRRKFQFVQKRDNRRVLSRLEEPRLR